MFLETRPRATLPELYEPRCLLFARIGMENQKRICLMQVSRPGEEVQAFREVSGVCEASVCFAVV